MLEDAAGIRRVVLACGSVDLRKGIDGLAMIIGDKYKQNPFEKQCKTGGYTDQRGSAGTCNLHGRVYLDIDAKKC